jgi:preprotein translocase subunit SecA
MFVELMGNIKGEVLTNLFRSTSNLMAFEKFLASLPAHLLRQDQAHPSGITDAAPTSGTPAVANGAGALPQEKIGITLHKESPKAGRNDPCPCGSGKKYKNCCGRTA